MEECVPLMVTDYFEGCAVGFGITIAVLCCFPFGKKIYIFFISHELPCQVELSCILFLLIVPLLLKNTLTYFADSLHCIVWDLQVHLPEVLQKCDVLLQVMFYKPHFLLFVPFSEFNYCIIGCKISKTKFPQIATKG